MCLTGQSSGTSPWTPLASRHLCYLVPCQSQHGGREGRLVLKGDEFRERGIISSHSIRPDYRLFSSCTPSKASAISWRKSEISILCVEPRCSISGSPTINWDIQRYWSPTHRCTFWTWYVLINIKMIRPIYCALVLIVRYKDRLHFLTRHTRQIKQGTLTMLKIRLPSIFGIIVSKAAWEDLFESLFWSLFM